MTNGFVKKKSIMHDVVVVSLIVFPFVVLVTSVLVLFVSILYIQCLMVEGLIISLFDNFIHYVYINREWRLEKDLFSLRRYC